MSTQIWRKFKSSPISTPKFLNKFFVFKFGCFLSKNMSKLFTRTLHTQACEMFDIFGTTI